MRDARSSGGPKNRLKPKEAARVRPAAKTAREPGDDALPEIPPRAVGLKAVGAFLRTARQGLGLTQDEVAAKTERVPWPVSRTTIGAIEQGKHAPNALTLLGLSHALRIDPMEIFDRLKVAVPRPKETESLDYDGLSKLFKDSFAAGDFRGSLAVLDATMDRLVQAEDWRSEKSRVRQAVTELRRATTLRRLGALTAAKASAERAVVQSVGMDECLADSYSILATVLSLLGYHPLAANAAAQAVSVSVRCPEDYGGRAWLVTGQVNFLAGNTSDSYDAFLRAQRLLERSKDTHNLITAIGNLGLCLLRRGQEQAAHERVAQAVELARKAHRPALEALWLVELGRIERDRDRLEEAWHLAETALAIARELENWLIVFRAVMLQHGITRRRNSADPDRHRVAYMKRLVGWIEENVEEPDVREFLEQIQPIRGSRERGSS